MKSDYSFPVLIFLTIILDRITKIISLNYFVSPVQIIPGIFQLALTINSGAAFSLLRGNNSLLVILSTGVIVLIAYSYTKSPKTIFTQAGFGLILGGAIGNIIDRLVYNGVVDFLYFISFPNREEKVISCH